MNLSIVKQKIKNNFKKNKFFMLVVLVIWAVLIFFTINKYKDSLGKEPIGNDLQDKVIELSKNVKIESIIPIEENTESISVKFATYARRNKGTVTIEISGVESGKVYGTKTINVNNIQDNSYITIGLSDSIDSKDSSFKIILTSDSEKDESVGVYRSSERVFDGSKLIINNNIVQGDLTLKYSIKNDDFNNLCKQIIYWSIVGLSALLISVFFIDNYEILFTSIIMIFGLIMMIIITPMSAPDEQLHYENCLQISNYLFGHAEDHIMVDYAYANDGYFSGHYNTSTAYTRLIKEFNEPMELSGDLKECNSDAEGSYYLYYIPQTIGIVLGRLLNINMLKLFYLGRLTNLIFYAICIYIALKNTPKYKLLFGMIATMPMFIQQVSSYSYDSFVFGLSFVELAFILKWIHQEEIISKKDYIFALIVSVILAPAKVVYGLFSFLYFFVPWQRFGSKKKKTLLVLLLCSPAIILVSYNIILRLWNQIVNLFTVFADESDDVNYIFTVKLWNMPYILEHPVETIMIILRTIRYQIKSWFYDSISHTLSGHTLVLPLYITYIHIVLLFISSFVKQEKMESIGFKLTNILICISIGLLTIVGMLAGWTERGAQMVNGVQGRYFCPLLSYFFITFNNNKFSISTKVSKYLICAQILVYFEVIVYVLSYTFLN
jgi:uncharacterized membrane protein